MICKSFLCFVKIWKINYLKIDKIRIVKKRNFENQEEDFALLLTCVLLGITVHLTFVKPASHK